MPLKAEVVWGSSREVSFRRFTLRIKGRRIVDTDTKDVHTSGQTATLEKDGIAMTQMDFFVPSAALDPHHHPPRMDDDGIVRADMGGPKKLSHNVNPRTWMKLRSKIPAHSP